MKTMTSSVALVALLALAGCDEFLIGAEAAQPEPILMAQNDVDLPSPDTADRRAEEPPVVRKGGVVSVRVAPVKREALNAWISADGTARAVRREYLSFESAGRIAFVDDIREGDRVKKGQLIAMQEQSRAVAEIAGADAGIADAQAGIANAESAIVKADAGIIDADAQIQVADASLREAMANLVLARKTFDRFAVLIAQASASQQEYDEALARLEQSRVAAEKARTQALAVRAQVSSATSQRRTALSQLATARAQVATARSKRVTAGVVERESQLVAPMDGIVAHLNIEQGFYFSPQTVQTNSEQAALDTVPVVIIDPSSFEIRVDVPAQSYGEVKRGARVLIEPSDRGGDAGQGGFGDGADGPSRDAADYDVRGTVFAVSPSFDPATRTFGVKVRTTAGARKLLDGEFVSVWIAGPKSDDALTIPRGATRFVGGKRVVFVVDEKGGTVRQVAIEAGAQTDTRIEVLSGLNAGMKVVTDGRSQLSDGDAVRVLGEAAR